MGTAYGRFSSFKFRKRFSTKRIDGRGLSLGVGGPSSPAATHLFARASDRYALSATSVPSNRRNLRARDCWAVKSALSVCGAHLVFAASPHYSKSIGILPTSPRKPEKQVGSKRPKKGQHPYRTRNVTDSAETPHQHTAKTNSQACEAGPPGLSDSKYACFVAQELCYLALLSRNPRLTPYSALSVFHKTYTSPATTQQTWM